MKGVLNHHNQENNNTHNLPRPSNHPSHESIAKPFRPTIKVGYNINKSQQSSLRRYTKPVLLIQNQPVRNSGLRKVPTDTQQTLSGQFIESEYVPKHTERSSKPHKKALADAYNKNYGGQQFSQQLRRQFITRSQSSYSITERNSLTERQKLNSYRNEGIKDIIQYQHAGQYRPERVASKCNEEGAESRWVRFKELHEYDFRKMKPLLLRN